MCGGIWFKKKDEMSADNFVFLKMKNKGFLSRFSDLVRFIYGFLSLLSVQNARLHEFAACSELAHSLCTYQTSS